MKNLHALMSKDDILTRRSSTPVGAFQKEERMLGYPECAGEHVVEVPSQN